METERTDRQTNAQAHTHTCAQCRRCTWQRKMAENLRSSINISSPSGSTTNYVTLSLLTSKLLQTAGCNQSRKRAAKPQKLLCFQLPFVPKNLLPKNFYWNLKVFCLHFLFACNVLLKQNCLHLVCYDVCCSIFTSVFISTIQCVSLCFYELM